MPSKAVRMDPAQRGVRLCAEPSCLRRPDYRVGNKVWCKWHVHMAPGQHGPA